MVSFICNSHVVCKWMRNVYTMIFQKKVAKRAWGKCDEPNAQNKAKGLVIFFFWFSFKQIQCFFSIFSWRHFSAFQLYYYIQHLYVCTKNEVVCNAIESFFLHYICSNLRKGRTRPTNAASLILCCAVSLFVIWQHSLLSHLFQSNMNSSSSDGGGGGGNNQIDKSERQHRQKSVNLNLVCHCLVCAAMHFLKLLDISQLLFYLFCWVC